MIHSRRREYTRLGSFLKKARLNLPKKNSVDEMADKLGVSSSFVYQVEQGKRKPKDGDMRKWAIRYKVNYVELWKCLDRIPMDLIASFKEKPPPTPDALFNSLTPDEKRELVPFMNFVRWKVAAYPASVKR